MDVLRAVCGRSAAPEDLAPALHAAATHGHAPAVRALLRAGAPLGALDDDGLTVLHAAAVRGEHQVVAALLESRADTERSPVSFEAFWKASRVWGVGSSTFKTVLNSVLLCLTPSIILERKKHVRKRAKHCWRGHISPILSFENTVKDSKTA